MGPCEKWEENIFRHNLRLDPFFNDYISTGVKDKLSKLYILLISITPATILVPKFLAPLNLEGGQILTPSKFEGGQNFKN